MTVSLPQQDCRISLVQIRLANNFHPPPILLRSLNKTGNSQPSPPKHLLEFHICSAQLCFHNLRRVAGRVNTRVRTLHVVRLVDAVSLLLRVIPESRTQWMARPSARSGEGRLLGFGFALVVEGVRDPGAPVAEVAGEDLLEVEEFGIGEWHGGFG